MFKIKNDELRRRYKERLSNARQTLLDQRRRVSSTGQNAPAPAQTDNIKHEILTKMQIDASVDLHETLDPDYLVQIMNEISEELRQEENLLLAEQEAYLNNQEIRQTMIAEATVCCPICLSHPLRQNKQVIFCACGMRIDCQVDHTTLQGFGESLNDCVNLHKYVLHW
ncbi:hypothetical protein SARC_01060 [Sphaeroforma arctica JP610]|uniref:RPA-interacting protein C-terminal domain-containing protein n=1 Tax=Sphaeroforma arctica JP610 TaxID=667725 RepID=A0A0L0GEU5_9EUKA|nr:hypothetical protein SARC_01060 [Sphaeroforma arctica JP610]KNC86798.1 hypothetical protein SARC_01060 [Sphaeroforma arctica JP610]|eukprot:XP_014160700.1 hypothetical protein SARC_01060 [Sphaeroforma arctica JP610]